MNYKKELQKRNNRTTEYTQTDTNWRRYTSHDIKKLQKSKNKKQE